MKNALFIIPYFGKFNNYFQLFLNSCGKNVDFNWLIVTDDRTKYVYPENVKVIYCTFEEFRNKVKNKFSNIDVCFNKPYKLCDFKPAYGYIFDEEIKNYKYWGFCDVDLIFGDISNFIDLNKLSEFDKIGVIGHFTLIKNCLENNNLFMKDNRYIEVYTSDKIFKFDEEYGKDFGTCINNIFDKYDKKILELDTFADIYVKSSNFKITHYDSETEEYWTEKKDKSFFVWDNGCLKKYIISKNSVKEKEYMYIHLQKRKMDINNSNMNMYKIIPNSFDDIEDSFFSKNYGKIKTKYFNLHYFCIRYKNLRAKIKKRRGENR